MATASISLLSINEPLMEKEEHFSLHDSTKQHALRIVLDRFFSASTWSRSRYLCVNDDPTDGAMRALQYCRWDLQETCNLIQANLDWRLREKVDRILHTRLPRQQVQAIRAAFGDGFHGVDLAGAPLYWCPAGSIDIASLKDRVPLQNMLTYHIQLMEYNQQIHLGRISRETMRTVHNFTGVIDLKNFGARNLNKSFRECMSLVSTVDRDYYYDNFSRVLIINAPLVFRLFWRTTSALFRAETKAKFIFLDKPEDLFKFVSKEVTPVRFGGTHPDEDALLMVDKDGKLMETAYSREMDAYMDKLSAVI